MNVNHKYKNLLEEILKKGVWRNDPNRTNVKRLQIPFYNMTLDLRKGFPLLNTKKMWWKGIVIETLWMLKGHTNIKELIDNGTLTEDDIFINNMEHCPDVSGNDVSGN